MEDRETARMRKCGGSTKTQIMMATVPHVTSGLGYRKFQADGFLLTRVYTKSSLNIGRIASCLTELWEFFKVHAGIVLSNWTGIICLNSYLFAIRHHAFVSKESQAH